ncbi:hypothetical protein [Hominisplanchenecus sp.]|uniref:putative PDDEXK endonuclease n=1 Tax=Hominisplanchenecus sp. TaxID=3038130 RepID=UPI0039910891
MADKIKKTRTPQQIGKASKQKGARFELEIAHYFKNHGFSDAHRTAQHCGKTGDAGDVEGVQHLHIECKHVEKLNLYNAYHQAVRDNSAKNNGDIPVVIHKKNRETVMVSLSLDDFIKIFSTYINEEGE